MPKREIIQSVILGRADKRISLEPGQVFDFTDAELDEIMAVNPNAISAKVTINLDSDVDATDALRQREVQLSRNEVSAPSTGDGDTTQAVAKKGGRKSAAAEDL